MSNSCPLPKTQLRQLKTEANFSEVHTKKIKGKQETAAQAVSQRCKGGP